MTYLASYLPRDHKPPIARVDGSQGPFACIQRTCRSMKTICAPRVQVYWHEAQGESTGLPQIWLLSAAMAANGVRHEGCGACRARHSLCRLANVKPSIVCQAQQDCCTLAQARHQSARSNW